MPFAEALEQKRLDEVLDVDGRRQHRLDHGHASGPWTGGSAQFIVGYSGPAGTGKAAGLGPRAGGAAYGDRFLPPESPLKLSARSPARSACRGLLRLLAQPKLPGPVQSASRMM